MEEFNIFSQENYINDDINVVYTPDASITKYEYLIYKDNSVVERKTIDQNKATTIILNETGSYRIEVKTIDSNNVEKTVTTGVYNIDKDSPIIEFDETSINMNVGDILYPLEGVKAYDEIDGNIISKVTTNVNELDLKNPGTKKLVYTVSDSAGNITSRELPINVSASNANALFMVQLSIIVFLTIIAGLIIFYYRSMRLEKRIAKYSVEPLKDNSLALFDNFWNYYNKVVEHIKHFVQKSTFITNYSKRYEKYVGVLNKNYKTGLDFVSSKILVSLIFVFIAIFSKTIQYELLSIYELCFPLIIGFFMPDIVYISKYKIHRNKVENDLLQAIIVMNNAFKSGRSITQAIELVTTELDGSIAEEFRKMHLEITFGLSVDVVFKRFADRINLEEVSYLTASLSILNQTGGNIIKVFSSIEKSLFDKKKLKLELASLTGSSKMLMYCLFGVPILFVIFVSIINPSYFKPFYTTTIGALVFGLIIIMYIIYIFIVKKIMKVRM